jgi:hypothetical protein
MLSSAAVRSFIASLFGFSEATSPKPVDFPNSSIPGQPDPTDVYQDKVDAINDALDDPRFEFRSLAALQKVSGASEEEVRIIVIDELGGRTARDNSRLFTL